MGVMNLLANVQGMPIYDQLRGVSLNWIGKIILWLTTVCGSVGVGIILFSLLLKLITLPFDVVQRISMRKQNNKMKENKERMEKLQKQYANDKDKYNQKVQEMYRESGISMMSSCLPMILSLVIFIVAINAFNAFASFSNVNNYNTLVRAYNTSMMENCAELNEENLSWEVIEDGKKIVYTINDDDKYICYTVKKDLIPTVDADGNEVYTDYTVTVDAEGNKIYTLNETVEESLKYVENTIDHERRTYEFKWDDYAEAMSSEQTAKAWEEEKVKEIQDSVAEGQNPLSYENALKKLQDSVIQEQFVSPAQAKVVEVYNTTVKKDTKFLWVKNVWAVDAVYKHPVLGWGDFSNEIITRKSCSCSGGDKSILLIPAYTFEGYSKVTGKLITQKTEANGYFIMILLSIGTILLQQFISMRSQKEQNKYSTVDGQGGGQQKMTMIIMTGMFAVFSFLYSSAFAIYLVISNLFSLLSTVVINKIVDGSFERKAAGATGKGDKVLSGRAAAVKKVQTKNKKNKK